MTATGSGAQAVADALAREAARYLNAVDLFAALGSERAARTHTAVTKRRGVRRWRT
jgi:hypothetical protein